MLSVVPSLIEIALVVNWFSKPANSAYKTPSSELKELTSPESVYESEVLEAELATVLI